MALGTRRRFGYASDDFRLAAADTTGWVISGSFGLLENMAAACPFCAIPPSPSTAACSSSPCQLRAGSLPAPACSFPPFRRAEIAARVLSPVRRSPRPLAALPGSEDGVHVGSCQRSLQVLALLGPPGG